MCPSLVHCETEKIEEYLQNGADLCYKNIQGSTCLHLAAMNGFHEFIEHLLLSEECNYQGKNPMDLALQSESDETVRIVFEIGILPSVPH